MMLKRSGKMGLPCFVPGLSGKASSFLPLRMMFIVSFANLPLTYLKLFNLILKNKSTVFYTVIFTLRLFFA